MKAYEVSKKINSIKEKLNEIESLEHHEDGLLDIMLKEIETIDIDLLKTLYYLQEQKRKKEKGLSVESRSEREKKRNKDKAKKKTKKGNSQDNIKVDQFIENIKKDKDVFEGSEMDEGEFEGVLGRFVGK